MKRLETLGDNVPKKENFKEEAKNCLLALRKNKAK
jgi:hypothetical protein